MHYNFSEPKKAHIGVPDQWIYTNYLALRNTFDGSSIRTYSPFNTERTPSLFIYAKNNKYIWKDHSSEKSGDAIDLAQALFQQASPTENVSYKATVSTIQKDYEDWKEKFGEYIPAKIEKENYCYELLSEAVVRGYAVHDLQYWSCFGVDRALLEENNILPLKWFRIGKKYKDNFRWGTPIAEKYSYGIYNNVGELIKVYNPFSDNLKHITFKKVLLGEEQLKGYKTLVIASGIKDLLTLKGLGLDIDVVAPIGEKVIIDSHTINLMKSSYVNILTLFDNDRTGVQAMMLYRTLYDLPFVYIPKCKDISEYRAACGKDDVYRDVTINITKKISKTILNEEDTKDGWKPVENWDTSDFKGNAKNKFPAIF